MSRIEKWFLRISLIIVSIILTLILIEAVANFYLWNMMSEDEFKFYASTQQLQDRYGKENLATQERSNAIYTADNYLGYIPISNYENEAGNRHNSLGFRGAEIALPKPADVYRIVALGGSTTYGTHVDKPTEAYPYLFQQYLRDNGYTNIEVINAGVSGYTSHETLLNFQFRVLELNPDLIIIYHATNDARARLIYPPSAYRPDNSGYLDPFAPTIIMPSIAEYSTALRIFGIATGQITSHNSLEWSWRQLANSAVYRELTRQYNQYIYPEGIFKEMSGMKIIEANPPIYFENNLKSIIGMAQSHDIEVMFATWAYSLEFERPEVRSKEFKFMHDQHNDITRGLKDQFDIYVYDFVEEMPQDKKYWSDGVHMTAEGNQLRAQLFGDYIIENVLDQSG